MSSLDKWAALDEEILNSLLEVADYTLSERLADFVQSWKQIDHQLICEKKLAKEKRQQKEKEEEDSHKDPNDYKNRKDRSLQGQDSK